MSLTVNEKKFVMQGPTVKVAGSFAATGCMIALGSEKIFEIMQMSVMDRVIVNALTDRIVSVCCSSWNVDNLPPWNEFPKLAGI